MASERDWVSNSRSFVLAWGVPIAALVLGGMTPPEWQTGIWFAALVWMGVACVYNAWLCRRTHCFVTGPFFLIMAVFVLLHGTGVLSWGPGGWRWLGIVIGVGGGALWCLPEMLLGKYIAGKPG